MRTPGRILSSLLLSATIFTQWGCESPPETRIDRETFISVYVDLRVAALQEEDAVIPADDRDRILADYQVSVDDLVEFAEVWGEDPDFMEGVWQEIETRLNVDSIASS